MLGPWRAIFLLATYLPKSEWQGSVSLLEQVGYKRVIIPDGKFKGGWFDRPDDEYLPLKQWEREHWEQARFILAELFGDIIRPGDNSQRAVEVDSENVLAWRVPYEGEPKWLSTQN